MTCSVLGLGLPCSGRREIQVYLSSVPNDFNAEAWAGKLTLDWEGVLPHAKTPQTLSPPADITLSANLPQGGPCHLLAMNEMREQPEDTIPL